MTDTTDTTTASTMTMGEARRLARQYVEMCRAVDLEPTLEGLLRLEQLDDEGESRAYLTHALDELR